MSRKRMHKTAIHERIELLEKQSDLIRDELKGELENTKQKATNIGKIAMGIGGGLILSALILRGFSGKPSTGEGKRYKSKRVYHKFKDQLIGEISGQALIFILGIAKNKIKSFLEQEAKKVKDDSEWIIKEEEGKY